jgi:hypothetical protein
VKPFIYLHLSEPGAVVSHRGRFSLDGSFDHGDFFTHPLTKSAAGWSMTGLMFLV